MSEVVLWGIFIDALDERRGRQRSSLVWDGKYTVGFNHGRVRTDEGTNEGNGDDRAESEGCVHDDSHWVGMLGSVDGIKCE